MSGAENNKNYFSSTLAQLNYLTDALHETELEVENLQAALGNARLIGAACGVVMARRTVTQDEAFAVLSRTSQNLNVKLALLARYVTDTGTVPTSIRDLHDLRLLP